MDRGRESSLSRADVGQSPQSVLEKKLPSPAERTESLPFYMGRSQLSLPTHLRVSSLHEHSQGGTQVPADWLAPHGFLRNQD